MFQSVSIVILEYKLPTFYFASFLFLYLMSSCSELHAKVSKLHSDHSPKIAKSVPLYVRLQFSNCHIPYAERFRTVRHLHQMLSVWKLTGGLPNIRLPVLQMYQLECTGILRLSSLSLFRKRLLKNLQIASLAR